MDGPLSGIRIVEFGGIGPAPFCAMMLADHGAEVIRIDRPGGMIDPRDPLTRSRRSIGVDMKTPDGAALLRNLIGLSDGLVEGFRPGVMERAGLGPDRLLAQAPHLVYGRMTGWGQSGPLAHMAGHDINYIAVSGVLGACGRAGGKPTPPINLLGDFGGGGAILAFGMVSALLAVQRGGGGQVIDCAMTEGSALLAASTYGKLGMNRWTDERGVNLLDTGAPFYDSYECADGAFIAIGALEPRFYARLIDALGLARDPRFERQNDAAAWPAMRAALTGLFRTRTRQGWCDLLEAADACFAPVLSLSEAPCHPHNIARGGFVEVGGITQPAPAPRFSAAPDPRPRPGGAAGDAVDWLGALGCEPKLVAAAHRSGALA